MAGAGSRQDPVLGLYSVIEESARLLEIPSSREKVLPILSVYGPQPGPQHFVDSMRHNPFYGEGAGLTSINGNQIVNFYDHIHVGSPVNKLSQQIVRAETFLVQDTGKKNSAGKDIVNIYGGVKWGFELERVT